MVDDDTLVGIDNQIVPQARQQEVACEFGAAVHSLARRRDDFDDDDRVGDLDRVVRQGRAAADQRIGLVDSPIVDLNRRAVWMRLAAKAACRDRRLEGAQGLVLHAAMADPLGGHGDNDTIVEFEASLCLRHRPGDEFISGELGLLWLFHRLSSILSITHRITTPHFMRHSVDLDGQSTGKLPATPRTLTIEDLVDLRRIAGSAASSVKCGGLNETLATRQTIEIILATFMERAGATAGDFFFASSETGPLLVRRRFMLQHETNEIDLIRSDGMAGVKRFSDKQITDTAEAMLLEMDGDLRRVSAREVRLAPLRITMRLNDIHHPFDRRSGSAIAEYALALHRISFACCSSRFSRSRAFNFSTISLGMEARLPLSTSAFLTQPFNVLAEQPILAAIDVITRLGEHTETGAPKSCHADQEQIRYPFCCTAARSLCNRYC